LKGKLIDARRFLLRQILPAYYPPALPITIQGMVIVNANQEANKHNAQFSEVELDSYLRAMAEFIFEAWREERSASGEVTESTVNPRGLGNPRGQLARIE
jgi:hypothetical protein